jgi:hypothetical protein
MFEIGSWQFCVNNRATRNPVHSRTDAAGGSACERFEALGADQP